MMIQISAQKCARDFELSHADEDKYLLTVENPVYELSSTIAAKTISLEFPIN